MYWFFDYCFFLPSASSTTRRHFCGIAPSAAHKFTHLLKLQVAALSLGPSSRDSCSHQTDSCRNLLPPQNRRQKCQFNKRLDVHAAGGSTHRSLAPPLPERSSCSPGTLWSPPSPCCCPSCKHRHTHTHTQLRRERERRRTRALREQRGDFETKTFSKTPLYWMD